MGSIFGPKNGVSHRRISLLPAHVVQADLRPCSLNMNLNSYLFLFVRPKSGCYCTELRAIHNSTRKVAVRSLRGRRTGAQKQTTHQETKRKLSAMPNRDKTIHCKHRKSIPPAMSQNQHLMLRKPATTTPKQFNKMMLWQRFAIQSATVFPGILPFRYTCKSIAFC